MISRLGQIAVGAGSVIYVILVLNPLSRYSIYFDKQFPSYWFYYSVLVFFWLPDINILFQFKFDSYSAEDDDYEGYDYSLHGRLSAVRIVFLYRFVQEVSFNFLFYTLIIKISFFILVFISLLLFLV